MLNYKKLIISLLFILLILSCADVSYAQMESLALELPKIKSGQPGEFITITAKLNNNLKENRVYKLDLNIPNNWAVVDAPSKTEIKGEEKKTLFITVLIPYKTLKGYYPIDIKLTAGNEEINNSTFINVLEDRNINLTLANVPELLPGDRGVYKVRITNNGNCKENIELKSLKDRYDWESEMQDSSLSLAPGESKNIKLYFKVPEELESGLEDDLKLVCETEDGELEMRKELLIEVLPPTPELVPPLKTDSLGTTLTLSTANRDNLDSYCRISSWGEIGAGHQIDFSGEIDLDGGAYDYNEFQFNYKRDPWEFYTDLTTEEEIYRIIYDKEEWNITAGDVDKQLSELVLAYGEGVKTDYKTKDNYTYSFLLLDGLQGIEIEREFDNTKYDLIYLVDDNNQGATKSLSWENKLYKNFWVDGEIADIDGELAKTLGLDWKDKKVDIGGQFYWYDVEFPNSDVDKRGYEFYIKGKTEQLPFNLEYRKNRNNIVDNPDVKTLEEREIIFTTYLPSDVIDITADINYSKINSIYLPVDALEVNKEIWKGSLDIEKEINRFDLGIRGKIDSFKDIRKNKEESELSIYPELAYNWKNCTLSFGYGLRGAGDSVSQARDNLNYAPVLGLDYYPRQAVIDDLSLEYKGGEEKELSINSQFVLSDRFSLNIDGELEDMENNEDWEIRAALTTRFGLPVPGVYSQGKISGRVLLERINKEVTGIENVILEVNNRKVSTNNAGQFTLPPMLPGKYDLKVKNIPFGYRLKTELPQQVEVKKGKDTKINIKLERVSQISGQVYYDQEEAEGKIISQLNQDSSYSLANISIELRQDDKLIKTVKADSNGLYHLANLKPGLYEVKIDEDTLPKRFKVTTKNPIKVQLNKNNILHHDFGIVEKDLKIDITYP